MKRFREIIVLRQGFLLSTVVYFEKVYPEKNKYQTMSPKKIPKKYFKNHY